MNYKILLAFLGGAAVGALISWKLLKDEYEALIDEETDAVREMYSSREIMEVDNIEGLTNEEYATRVDKVIGKYYPGAEANEAKKNMIYRKPDLKKMRYDACCSATVYTDDPLKEEVVNVDAPYVISLDDFTNDKNYYEKLSLYYYDEDDMLIDDREEVLPEIDMLIGDALTRFGEGSLDPDIVYVRNDRMACDYEVVRYYKSYQETVLGLPQDEALKRRRLNEGESFD